MTEQNGGGILYKVEMDVAGLLVGQRKVNARLEEMEGRFSTTGKAVGSTEKAFSSLSRVAVSLSAALSVQQVAQYANAWVDVNNKLVNAVRPTEQLADVTQRVFDISQETRSGLESTAALYGRLERATRSAGTSAEALAKLTTTINKGLIVSGATTQEASSTMIQLSQALASGVLRGEEFNSISENGSRLAVALADALGVTAGQLRAMAAEGKLTTDVVVKGLLSQGDVIAKEFGNTIQTMGQAFQIAGNNITKFIGESTSVQSGLKVFNDAVVSLSENVDVAAGVVTAFAVVLGGRYVGSLAMATQAKVSDMLASQAHASAVAADAAAAANAAAVTARKALLDKEAALSSLALAQAEYNVAKGTNAEAFALQNLNTAKSVAIQRSAVFAEAQLAQAAATTTATTAAAAATTTIGGLARGALSLIGGPAGAAMIAGAALFYFYQKAQQAKQESIDFADKLDGVIAKMRTMSNVQLAAEIDKAAKSINVQSGELKNNEARLTDLTSRLQSAKAAVAGLSEGSLFYSDAVSKVSELESEHIQLTAKVEAEQSKLSQTISKAGILRAQMNGEFRQGIDLLKRDGQEASVTAGLFGQLGDAINFAGRAKEKFNSQSLIVERPKNVQDYLDKLNDQVEIQGELNDRKRAQLKAEKDIRSLGGSEQDVLLARERAGAEFDATKAIQEQKKATKEGIAEGKKSASQAESVAQKLANLKQQSELAADSTSELSREQAILTAQLSLGKGATQAQIDMAAEYEAKKWDTANAIKAQAAAEKLLPEAKENASYAQDVKDLNTALAAKKISQEQYNITAEQLEQQHQVNLAKIRAEAVVSPQQQAAGMVDPVQQLANENAQKLALIQQFENDGALAHDQALALRTAADRQYDQQRTEAQWQLLSQQSLGYDMLTSAVDAFSGNASNAITGLLTGTMSAQEAMRSLGNTILNSVINSIVQVGVEALKNYILGQTLGAASMASSVGMAATTASAWAPAAAMASLATLGANAAPAAAGITSTVGLAGGLALAGARYNGGPVSAGAMYQVGERGKPEIYQASTGKQYMIPGDNGKVLSNKQISGGGSAAPTIIIENYSSGAGVMDTQASKGADGSDVVRIVLADLQQGGQISQGISQYHQAPRKATE
ncbi:tape measure protein [Serratia marcescens]|uniref:tape measure protein n=1 Tax=Serratia marcescens TaxID=615 RepID=UPI001FB644E0|nr:tape measure protein [Serratia marcescens]MCW6023029.1 tape measure protein [Serratia marcescens]UOG72128.1 tape measure protein [Serratia marcescens]